MNIIYSGGEEVIMYQFLTGDSSGKSCGFGSSPVFVCTTNEEGIAVRSCLAESTN
jgi:hypothetical protein